MLDLKRSCRRPGGRERGQEGPGRQRSRPGRAEQEAKPWKASPAGPKVKPPGGGVFFVLDLKRSCRRPGGRERGQEGPGRQRSRPGRAEQEAKPWKASPAGPKVKPPEGGVFFVLDLKRSCRRPSGRERGQEGPDRQRSLTLFLWDYLL
ncbi:hypothetical protein C5O22_10820 [Treponema sp. J25]|nr:hypothetical protein C5O22_10820 [Treponema sp. J25]